VKRAVWVVERRLKSGAWRPTGWVCEACNRSGERGAFGSKRMASTGMMRAHEAYPRNSYRTRLYIPADTLATSKRKGRKR